MPIFCFRCISCDRVYEKIVLHKVDRKIEDLVDEIAIGGCECGGKLTVVSGAPNLQFIGKDFYVTEERARKEKERVAKDVYTAKRNIAISESKNQ